MTDRELMQMALDNLRWINDEQAIMSYATVKALRNRLAQPEPEPVAWLANDGCELPYLVWEIDHDYDHLYTYTPLYTAPPKREWVGLTKDEVDSWELPDTPTVFKFCQFIEAKLKEKNS